MLDFTVVVPVYNTIPEHLLEGVMSIVNQTIEQDYTINIIDDGSTNAETLRMLKYLSKIPKVKVQYLKENVGVAEVLNGFHKSCTNKYIAVCGSDDIQHKDKFKLQVEYLVNNPDVSVLSTQLYGFNDSDIERKPLFKSEHKLECHPKVKGDKRDFWIANHGTVIYKNDDVIAAGGYDPKLRRAQDVDLWKRMYANGCKFRCLQRVLYGWRRFIS